ncbi:MAG: hypothetical protein ACKOCM_02700 [Cyanobacteriota bacterium]
MVRVLPVGLCMTLMVLAGCVRPDGRALRKLACEHVASTIDVQSVNQLDALRKALGVVPDVDPLQTCRDLGVTMESGGQRGESVAPGPNPDGPNPDGRNGESGQRDKSADTDADNEDNLRQN